MFKDDDEDEENTFGVTRYACMPSLVALQQMRNRLHLAHLGRKLMKWTALATGRELRKIAIQLDEVVKGFAEEMREAFILLARARYFCPELNKIVLENIGHDAAVMVVPTMKTVSAVKTVQFEILETGIPPYAHLGLEKGGQAIMEAKMVWLDLLKKLIMMMQLRSSFIMVEQANKTATKKWNVLSKLVAPKVALSVRYIVSELEEIEREDNFRLKRFKELKTKKKKGDDDFDYSCYCDKKPGKGDDFICSKCKHKEERQKETKKNIRGFQIPPCIMEAIGDKASTLNAATQKQLDDLTTHLEKVISLTSHCKTEGLVSPSVDTFIYACKEVRSKIEAKDQTKNPCESNQQDASCSVCDDRATPKEVTCKVCKESKEPNEPPNEQNTCKICNNNEEETTQTKDLFGCFMTKQEEIVKVKKIKNPDGTISEEKRVITIKIEKKCPQNPDALGEVPCCKIESELSMVSDECKTNNDCCEETKEAKSEDNPCRTNTDKKEKRNEPRPYEVCNPPPKPSQVPKKCPSAVTTGKPKDETKCCKSSNEENKPQKSVNVKLSDTKKPCEPCIKNQDKKKDESCACKVETKTVCCEPIWIDVSCSTTGLAESPEDNDELCICVKDFDANETTKKESANCVGVCCNKNTVQKKASLVCSVSSKNSKKEKKPTKTCTCKNDTTTNIDNEENSMIEQCCPIPEPDEEQNNKTCCKLRIVSKQEDGSEEEKVQEIIFYGNILDAIKKILSLSDSGASLNQTTDNNAEHGASKSCSCTRTPSNRSSKKTYKVTGRSQSCPHCDSQNEEKKNFSSQRSKSESCCPKAQKKAASKSVCCDKPAAQSISKCSICISVQSKATSDRKSYSGNHSGADSRSCASCQESCASINLSASSKINDQESPCECSSEDASQDELVEDSSTSKICQTGVGKKDKKSLQAPKSCPVCSAPSQNQCKPDCSNSKAKPTKSQYHKTSCPNKTQSSKPCPMCSQKNKSESVSKCSVCGKSLSKSSKSDANRGRKCCSGKPSETQDKSCPLCQRKPSCDCQKKDISMCEQCQTAAENKHKKKSPQASKSCPSCFQNAAQKSEPVSKCSACGNLLSKENKSDASCGKDCCSENSSETEEKSCPICEKKASSSSTKKQKKDTSMSRHCQAAGKNKQNKKSPQASKSCPVCLQKAQDPETEKTSCLIYQKKPSCECSSADKQKEDNSMCKHCQTAGKNKQEKKSSQASKSCPICSQQKASQKSKSKSCPMCSQENTVPKSESVSKCAVCGNTEDTSTCKHCQTAELNKKDMKSPPDSKSCPMCSQKSANSKPESVSKCSICGQTPKPNSSDANCGRKCSSGSSPETEEKSCPICQKKPSCECALAEKRKENTSLCKYCNKQDKRSSQAPKPCPVCSNAGSQNQNQCKPDCPNSSAKPKPCCHNSNEEPKTCRCCETPLKRDEPSCAVCKEIAENNLKKDACDKKSPPDSKSCPMCSQKSANSKPESVSKCSICGQTPKPNSSDANCGRKCSSGSSPETEEKSCPICQKKPSCECALAEKRKENTSLCKYCNKQDKRSAQAPKPCPVCSNAGSQNQNQCKPDCPNSSAKPKPCCPNSNEEPKTCRCCETPLKRDEPSCAVCKEIAKNNLKKDACECTSKSDAAPKKSCCEKLPKTDDTSCSVCQKKHPCDCEEESKKDASTCTICKPTGPSSKQASKQDGQTDRTAQNSNQYSTGSCPNIKPTKPLCYPPQSNIGPDCTECKEKTTKDASTTTRRSDRYDVRPLEMVKTPKKPTCACRSDSHLMKSTQASKKSKSCSSCHADFFT